MKRRQIMTGFSEIKTAFRTKTRTEKTAADLRLWFTQTNEVLYVHDYENHESCIVLAVKAGPIWSIKSTGLALATKLISTVASESREYEVAAELNRLFQEYGTFRN